MNKKDTHIVLKMDDVRKYLSDEQIYELNIISQTIQNGREKDGKNKCNEYYICNVDEPYSDKVLDVILKGGNENEYMELGAKIALQGVKEKINNITEEMTRKGIDTKYFEPIKAFVDDRLAECEINEKG